MQTTARRALRVSLTDQGFRRTSFTHDAGDGVYSETFVHDDETSVVINWAARSTDAATSDISDNAAADTGVVSTPGMYDAPDNGLSFPIAGSDEENRIR